MAVAALMAEGIWTRGNQAENRMVRAGRHHPGRRDIFETRAEPIHTVRRKPRAKAFDPFRKAG